VRVFAAIFPPDQAVVDLARVVEPVRRTEPELRWTAPARWHLTLAHFGNITEDDAARLNATVATLAQRPALRVRLAGAGAFPVATSAQILWTGVDCPGEALRGLSSDLLAAVQRFGWTTDRRVFQAHVTLARCRSRTDLRPAVAALSGYRGPAWPVPSIAVVWSRPAAAGEPDYNVLAEHHFCDAG